MDLVIFIVIMLGDALSKYTLKYLEMMRHQVSKLFSNGLGKKFPTCLWFLKYLTLTKTKKQK